MARIVIQGLAAVFRNDVEVTDPAALRSLGELEYDDERFTDYLGGNAEEDALAEVLQSGGSLRFNYRAGESMLIATTEYLAKRHLSETELKALVDYTIGQWSDGIGENWTCESAERCGFTIMCLTSGAGVNAEYPSVRVIEEAADA